MALKPSSLRGEKKSARNGKKEASSGTQIWFTIKISRMIRNYIEKAATLSEPADRTLRRLLGLTLQPGEYRPKSRKPSDKAAVPWTTIKVSASLRDHITGLAKWNESVDHTLRRLLELPFED